MLTVAEVLFPAANTHVVLALDGALARDTLAAEAVTLAATRAGSPDGLDDDLERLAESLDWHIAREPHGEAELVMINRA